MPEMQVVAVGVDPESQPLLILRESEGERRILPVWIGIPEASVIVAEQQQMEAPALRVHELIADVITGCGRSLRQVAITAFHGDVFDAELVLDDGVRVGARVSDAVALALHVGVAIIAEDSVLAEAALSGAVVEIDTDAPADETDTGLDRAATGAVEVDEEEIERFRRELDNSSPEDFDRPPGSASRD
jgi:bifunctional DNase/RNase